MFRHIKTVILFFASLLLINCGGGGGDKPSTGPYTPPANVAVSSVSLSKTTVDLVIGGTIQLTATVSPSNATDKSVTWSSSNQTIATVTPTGLVTANAEGTTNITANASGKTAICKVTVKKPTVAVTSVELDQTEITLKKGATQTLKATVKPDNATDKTVSWASSKTDIATVDNTGKVTAIAKGSATITASCGGKTATCKVNVTIPVESVSLSETSLTLEKGSSATLTATVKPDDATDKTVSWNSTNTSVATVTSGGIVVAVGGGTATIMATAGDQTAVCNVTVTVSVTGITLDIPSMNLIKGETKALTATISPTDATDKTVTWTSNNSSIASVDNYGIVTAQGGGTTTIVATCSGKTAYCNVTVTVPVSSVSLNKTELSLKEGTSETLTATVNPDDATDKTVTWTSSNAAVASVDNTGKVTANIPGSTQITASSGGKSAVCTVTVTKKGGLSDRPDEEI